MTSMNKVFFFICFFLAIIMSGCQLNFEEIARERQKYASSSSGDIYITAIRSEKDNHYINGINLGVEFINSQNLLNERKIILNVIDEGVDYKSMEKAIYQIVNDPKMVAVIGHRNPEVAIPASVVYEQSELIFMPPFITSTVLGGAGKFKYIFKTLPDDLAEVEQISSLLKFTRKNKIALLFSQSDHNKELAIKFSSRAEDRGLKVVSEIPFPQGQELFSPYIEEIKKIDFDAIVISSSTQQAALLIDQIRTSGINAPIITTDSINKEELANSILRNGDKIIALSSYDKDNRSIRNKVFKQSYYDRFAVLPDEGALLGYDSIFLLAEAIKLAGSTHPESIAAALHNMPAWNGVNDIYEFDEIGTLHGKRFHFEILLNSHWQKIPYSDKLHAIYLIQNRFGYGDDFFDQLIMEDILINDEYKRTLLTIAGYILEFKDLGIVYVDDEVGRKKIDYETLKAYSNFYKTNLVECPVPAVLRKNITLFEDAIKTCYDEISLRSDAIYIKKIDNLDLPFYDKLSSEMHDEKIPLFSIDTPDELKEFLVFSLDKSDIIFGKIDSLQVFPKLLSSMTIYEFSKMIKNIPEISINFDKYKRYRLNEDIILDLTPVKQISKKQTLFGYEE